MRTYLHYYRSLNTYTSKKNLKTCIRYVTTIKIPQIDASNNEQWEFAKCLLAKFVFFIESNNIEIMNFFNELLVLL